MKIIVFDTDSLIMGGAEKLAIQYIKLLANDYKVILLVNEDNGQEGNILEKDIPKNVEYRFVVDKKIMNSINELRKLKQENPKNLWYKIKYNYFLKKRRKSFKENIEKIIKGIDYDILIDFCTNLPLTVIDERTISWIHLSLEKIKRGKKKSYKERFKKVKKIVVINESMKKEFEKYFSESTKKVECIYNFFDIEEIEKKSTDDRFLLDKEKELLKEKYIFACCRLDKQKDLETLIIAFSNLKIKNRMEEKLFIAGDGDKKKSLEELKNKLDMDKEIIFLGTQKNPYIWMKNAKMFVHSSYKEGFGMVIVEAMIANGFVLSSDCPVGPREILENGKSGILVVPQNVDEMEKALYRALNDKNLEKEKKENAKIRMEDFSQKNNYKKIVKIIEEI